MEHRSSDDWKVVFKTGIEYEAGLVCERLRAADIPAVILNQRDSAYNLNFGDLAQIKVMVPLHRYHDALNLLDEAPLTDEELEAAALAADPFDEEAEEEVEKEDKDEE